MTINYPTAQMRNGKPVDVDTIPMGQTRDAAGNVISYRQANPDYWYVASHDASGREIHWRDSTGAFREPKEATA